MVSRLPVEIDTCAIFDGDGSLVTRSSLGRSNITSAKDHPLHETSRNDHVATERGHKRDDRAGRKKNNTPSRYCTVIESHTMRGTQTTLYDGANTAGI